MMFAHWKLKSLCLRISGRDRVFMFPGTKLLMSDWDDDIKRIIRRDITMFMKIIKTNALDFMLYLKKYEVILKNLNIM